MFSLEDAVAYLSVTNPSSILTIIKQHKYELDAGIKINEEKLIKDDCYGDQAATTAMCWQKDGTRQHIP